MGTKKCSNQSSYKKIVKFVLIITSAMTMRKVILIATLCIIYAFGLNAQIIEVDSLDKTATELIIPKCHTLSSTFEGKGFDNLRTITFQGIDFLPGETFKGLQKLEEVIFNGDNLNIGGCQYCDLPKLKRVVMNGNTFLVNGSTAVVRCPEFETFEINGLITYSEMSDPSDSPKFKGYTGDFAMLYNGNSEMITATPATVVAKDPRYIAAFKRQFSQVADALSHAENDSKFASRFIWFNSQFEDLAKQMGLEISAYVQAYRKAKENPAFWTKLETLQHSPAYAIDTVTVKFTYQSATQSGLAKTRQRFNLDSIAGHGNDISKIKNLTCWVHDLVRHDGGSYNPSGTKTLANLVDSCRLYDRGVNCRMMAIMLTEALLAEGIPARYLTCQPKDYDTDSDCHVICVAWSESLNKWVWADPTFAAFVTDKNGLMLHPGEVRQHLMDNEQLLLNEDANWNHEELLSKEDYLDYYMAKNLYFITAITDNRQAPEGDTLQSVYITLSPVRSNYAGSQIVTTDYYKFWQSPK